MKISNESIHPNLRSAASQLNIYNFLLSSKWGFQLLHRLIKLQKGKKIKGLYNEEQYIKSSHGETDIRIRIYKPLNTNERLPVMLYLHGGGYAIGCPEQASIFFSKIIAKRPCVIVAPAYRTSLEAPYPAAFNDCYDTLLWINENTDLLNAIKGKIILAGHSAGGGLTAALTLKARDTKDVQIAFQMPIYPMIDDRQTNASSKFISPIWDTKTNAIGWNLYLKDLKLQNTEIPSYAAPARNNDYSNFPPTITFVGDIEPFRDETIEYVEALKQSNIPVKFQLYEGCFHAFENFLPKREISRSAHRFIFDSYAEYYDLYIK